MLPANVPQSTTILIPPEELRAKLDNITAQLSDLKIRHHVCDDCWYSCPKSSEGCCDDSQSYCNCGADEHNARVDAVAAQYEACRERLAIAVSLLTAAQLAEYKERVENEWQNEQTND